MMRRFEIGPLLVAVAALVLLVSLFADWYGNRSAWDAFEITDLLLAALAVAALVSAIGILAPEVGYLDRRWVPAAALAIVLIVVAELVSSPPTVGDATPQPGAWVAFGASLAMLAGAVLSVGRVSFSVAVEGREPRQRVAAVDHRQPTTDTGSVVAPDVAPGEGTGETGETEPIAPKPGRRGRKA
jgi:hypothetical protein